MKASVALILGAAIVSAATATATDRTPVQLTGHVHHATESTPAGGLQVLLFDLESLDLVAGATTDRDGFFALRLRAPASPSQAPTQAGTPQGPGSARPTSFQLQQNYPNPFNPATAIPYQLARPAHVRLEVFDLLGQRVRTLVDELQGAGDYQTLWHARDDWGRGVAAGVYVCRMWADGASRARKMVLIDGPAGSTPMAGRAGGTTVADAGAPALPLEGTGTGAFPAGVYGLTISGSGVDMYVDPSVRLDTDPLSVAVGPAPPTVTAKVTASPVLGDVNNDGAVDSADALVIATHGIDPDVTVPNGGDITLGEVNGDGQVDIADALIVASFAVQPENSALPAGLALGPGIVVNATPHNRDGIAELSLYPGQTITLNAASHLGTDAPVFTWQCDTPSALALETDPDDASIARAEALGEGGQSAVLTVEDEANQYSRVLTVEILVPPTIPPMLGDVNNDGMVDVVDALVIATYGVDQGITVPNNGVIAQGEVNGDARIDVLDALIVASHTVHPQNPALPGGIGLGPGIVVNGTPTDRDGIEDLALIRGNTRSLTAASYLGGQPPAFSWHSDAPSVVSVEVDGGDPAAARAVALGDSGQTALLTVEDVANQFAKTLPVEIRTDAVEIVIEIPLPPDEPDAQPLPAALAYFPFNGTAQDESGNGNHGILRGPTPTEDRWGAPGGALQFDGVDDYIVTQGNLGISGSRARTVSLWLKLDAFWDNMPLVSWGDYQDRGTVCGVWVYERERNIRFVGHHRDVMALGEAILLGRWTHVVATYDGITGRIYVDTQLQAAADFALRTSDTPASFGTDLWRVEPAYFNRPFSGALDGVRIYDRALSEEEILLLYLEGI